MKGSAFRSRKLPELPIAWREAEYAALRANSAAACAALVRYARCKSRLSIDRRFRQIRCAMRLLSGRACLCRS